MTTTVVPTGRPRAGRRFAPVHELALEDAALAACETLPGASDGIYVVREMTGPIGVPDFAALVGATGRLEQRLQSTVPPLLNEVDAGIVAVASARTPRTIDALAQRLGWPIATVERRLPSLLRARAINESRRGRFVRAPELATLGNLYAVETKVRDVSRALHQARTYSVWVDSYVLVMGAVGAAARERLRAQARADRGGLVVDGSWLVRPGVRRPPAARRLWASEHFVAALVDDYQPSSSA